MIVYGKGTFKYNAILFGGERSHQKDHKISQGGGHQKVTEDHDHKGRGVACEKIGQTGYAHKGNNYSKDQLSMGDQKV